MKECNDITSFHKYVIEYYFNNGKRKNILQDFIELNNVTNKVIVISYIPIILREYFDNKHNLISTLDISELEIDATGDFLEHLTIYKNSINSSSMLYLLEYPTKDNILQSERMFIFEKNI